MSDFLKCTLPYYNLVICKIYVPFPEGHKGSNKDSFHYLLFHQRFLLIAIPTVFWVACACFAQRHMPGFRSIFEILPGLLIHLPDLAGFLKWIPAAK
jgi:hypothetical protein